jgi:hypothetical protein
MRQRAHHRRNSKETIWYRKSNAIQSGIIAEPNAKVYDHIRRHRAKKNPIRWVSDKSGSSSQRFIDTA